MDQPTFPAPIMRARRLLAGIIAAPEALTPLLHLDLQLAAGDLEALWRNVRPAVESEPEPSQDVPRDLNRALDLLLADVDQLTDVPTTILIAAVARQVQLIIIDLDQTPPA